MIITQDQFPTIRERHRNQIIVYCSGNFDLTHARHILFLSRCKSKGDILVVGVGPDYDIKRNKNPDRPIQNEQIRLYTVDNLKPVDYCCLNDRMQEGYHKLINELKALRLLRPDIYMINDDAYDIPYRQKIADEYGVKLIIGEREGNIPDFLKGISTTELIEQIRGK